jgi:hypothetical protein
MLRKSDDLKSRFGKCNGLILATPMYIFLVWTISYDNSKVALTR